MSPKLRERTLKAPARSLSVLAGSLREFAREAGLAEDLTSRALLILDEHVANLLHHASRSAEIEVRVTLRALADGLRMEIEDDGPAFDPFDGAEPDPGGDPGDRPAGGWGIRLIRSVADEAEYSRNRGRNRVAVVVRARPADP